MTAYILFLGQLTCVQAPFADSEEIHLHLDINDIVHKQLTISPNATITFIEGEKTFQDTLTPEQMAILKNLIMETGFLSYQQDPDDEAGVLDGVAFALTVSLGKADNQYTSLDCWGEDEWDGFNRIIEWLMKVTPREIDIIGWA